MDHERGVKLAKDAAATIALGVLPGPASVLADIAKLGLQALGGTGTDRLRDAVQAEVEETVFSSFPALQQQVKRLEAEGVKVNTSDVARIIENFARSWSSAADAKKRKVLEDAFVRSFDRELYESGLLNALWERLDRLSYGDLFLLRELGEAGKGAATSVQRKHDLVNGSSLARFHATNLLREGLGWSPAAHSDPSGTGITDLGLRLYELALRGDAVAGAEGDRGA